MKVRVDSPESQSAVLPFLGFTFACTWPGVMFAAHNWMQFQWIGAKGLVVVALTSAAFWLAGVSIAVLPHWTRIPWSAARAYCVQVFGVYLLFGHEVARTWLRDALGLRSILASTAYALVVAVMLAVTWRLSRHKPVRTGFVVWAALLLTMESAGLASAMLRTPAAQAGSGPSREAAPRIVSGRENVYYVVLDGYAGSSVLLKYFNYRLEPFLREMDALGYWHASAARTNYVTTYVSLAATLEMDYVVREGSPRYRDRRGFFPNVLAQVPPPRVVRQLTAAGYEFYHWGNAWAPCAPTLTVRCIDEASTDADFAKRIVSAFLAPTKVPQALYRMHAVSSTNPFPELELVVKRLVSRKRPFFLFVHHISPHPPYRRPDCSSEPGIAGLYGGREEHDRSGYTHSIDCVNEEVVSLSRTIQASDPNAIVVFQADHGSDFAVDWDVTGDKWSDAAVDERSGILNLVKVPQPCRDWLRLSLSQINTMRLVMGCLARTAPEYLDDRTYTNYYESNPAFGIVHDVTSRLPEHAEAGRTDGGRGSVGR
jgi:hypothetical protein